MNGVLRVSYIHTGFIVTVARASKFSEIMRAMKFYRLAAIGVVVLSMAGAVKRAVTRRIETRYICCT
jgi:hypothetical protein